MTILIYGNHIATDNEQMDDHIFNVLSQHSQYPSDERIGYEFEDKVETKIANATDIIEYMKLGYIFLDYCGAE